MISKRCTSAGLFAVLGLLGLTNMADAQVRPTAEWGFQLAMPTTQKATPETGDGILWGQLRRTGLKLRVAGAGEITVVMLVLDVQDGRVVQRWRSAPFAASNGISTVAGRQLPDAQALRADGTSRLRGAVPATRSMSPDVLLTSDDLSQVLPRHMTRGRALVLFIAPERDGSGSAGTTPLFANLEPVMD